MSRLAGEMFMPSAASYTTVSPMVMRPSVGVSKPAIIRSVVVLPQPEGPKQSDEVTVFYYHIEVVNRNKFVKSFSNVFKFYFRHNY